MPHRVQWLLKLTENTVLTDVIVVLIFAMPVDPRSLEKGLKRPSELLNQEITMIHKGHMTNKMVKIY